MNKSNFSKLLWQAYQQAPDQIAITLIDPHQPDLDLSYSDLIRRSAGYAHTLDQAGIRPGQVVILILNHGVELIAAFYGAILQGAIPSIMPFLTEKLSPAHYRASLEALFEITSPAAIFTYPDFLEDAKQAAQNTPTIRLISSFDQIYPINTPDPLKLCGLERGPEDIVLLQHSSGTTGLQKGVALSHQAVVNQLSSYSEALQLGLSDVIVSWLPLYHDMGLIAGFILPILTRVRLVLMSPFDWVRAPAKLFHAITRYQGTLCWLPNFAYNFCAQKIRTRDLEHINLSRLRAVINCSEPMYWQSHKMFLEKFQDFGLQPEALATCYAMAENVFAVTQGGIGSPVRVDEIDAAALITQGVARPVRSSTSDEQRTVKMLSAGRPIQNTHLRVIDSAGNEIGERQVGEIAIQSNCILTGYYNRPDLSASSFQDGWYLTGDLGYLADGELYVTGRKKDLIIVGGKNVYPQDLERLTGEVEGVHPGRVVAFGLLNDQTGTEDVVIVAELDNFDELSQEQVDDIAGKIRNHITRGSDIALRLVHLVGRNWLLKTSSGKIARSANREKYLALPI
jgi:acyl-CoA synthetase (AMP-forming)/AMP-acid ligase II